MHYKLYLRERETRFDKKEHSHTLTRKGSNNKKKMVNKRKQIKYNIRVKIREYYKQDFYANITLENNISAK